MKNAIDFSLPSRVPVAETSGTWLRRRRLADEREMEGGFKPRITQLLASKLSVPRSSSLFSLRGSNNRAEIIETECLILVSVDGGVLLLDVPRGVWRKIATIARRTISSSFSSSRVVNSIVPCLCETFSSFIPFFLQNSRTIWRTDVVYLSIEARRAKFQFQCRQRYCFLTESTPEISFFFFFFYLKGHSK